MGASNQTILVTGTSSGFGRRITQTLAGRGHRVFASMRGPDGKNAEAGEALRKWADAESAELEVLELDITDQATVDRAVAHILDTTGRIDVFVNNAATVTVGILESFSLEEVRASLETVALGALRVGNDRFARLWGLS